MIKTHRFYCTSLPRHLLPLLIVGAMALALSGCSDDETGGSVTQIPFPEPDDITWVFSIWGSGADDVFMVGNPGFVLHYDGTDWTRTDLTEETLTSVWGTAANDVYVCGHHGVLFHYDGANWSSQDSGTEENLYDIGEGPYGDLYTVGYAATLKKRSGGSWVSTQRQAYREYPDPDDEPEDLAPADTLNFWDGIETLTVVSPYVIGGNAAVALMENNTTEFSHEWAWGEVEDQYFSLFTASTNSAVVEDNFLATATGKVLRLTTTFDGLQLVQLRNEQSIPNYPATYPSPLTDLWLDADNDVLYMTTSYGQITIMNQDGSFPETLYADSGYLSTIWGTSGTNIYAAGYGGVVLHYDGSDWTSVDVPLPEQAVKASPAHDKFGRPLR